MRHRDYLYCICLLVPALAACSGMQLQREKYVKDHPALSVDIQNAVANGEILEGMTEEEVRASWGPPDSALEHYEGLNASRWIYYRKEGYHVNVHEVVFIDGKVTDVKSYGERRSTRRFISFE